MQGHIDAAKKQVLSIVDDIKEEFLNEAEVRIAVVGYKDHADTPNIQFLDFTPLADQVRSFIGRLTADGGGDGPEDVLGGIRQALNATWQQQTRCIIHIADAPPHGRTLNEYSDYGDDYPEPGSEPHGLTYEPLLKQMTTLNINYALLRINSDTDLMAYSFLKVYQTTSADCKLHASNRYYSQSLIKSTLTLAATRGGGYSRQSTSTKAGLLFEETQLGTSFSALRSLVVKIVTASASRTALRVSMLRSDRAFSSKKYTKDLTAIKEDEEYTPGDRLETSPPKWDKPDWLNETLIVEGFSPDVVVHHASTLNDMMASDDNIKMSVTELTIRKRSLPFAQGSQRVASYARTANSSNRFVVKSFKRGGKRLAHLAEDMRCQALCKAFALEFNTFSGEEHPIDFIVTTCLKGRSGTGSASGDDCLSLEPFIEGTYIKYNNNSGYVNNDNPEDRFNQAAQAFSHFTFERSQGYFLVADLQGVGYVLTDPAIHTLDRKRFMLADTNLGEEGFKFFFATHQCNDICRKLGLMTNKSMVISGRYEFRKSWPPINNTVCCSNQLCGKIVRVASAKRSDKYPGCNWCDSCWPQLHRFSTKLLCIAPGPHHEFEVSKFFYESQGRRTPRTCPDHRKASETGARVAAVSTSLWDKFKSASKMNSHTRTRLSRKLSNLESSITPFRN
ncbi:hypothetical protein CC78DRAFT_529421 [Lojkania enalia]|uniref:Alpha-type protein kinase domain-containing protein n=1 Tax=Lojkania enalia TaxID=147567 RepID=A0A9P4N9P1_9PLEO|nr:hypothetical protein CC78DRAFT_529421 [Didymosphaeria enalia]